MGSAIKDVVRRTRMFQKGFLGLERAFAGVWGKDTTRNFVNFRYHMINSIQRSKISSFMISFDLDRDI